jgi:hypothetical protein
MRVNVIVCDTFLLIAVYIVVFITYYIGKLCANSIKTSIIIFVNKRLLMDIKTQQNNNINFKNLISISNELTKLTNEIIASSAKNFSELSKREIENKVVDSNTIDRLEKFIGNSRNVFKSIGLEFKVSDAKTIVETRRLEIDVVDVNKFINFLSILNSNKPLAQQLKPFIEDNIQKLFYDLLAPNSFTKADRIDTEILLLTNLDKISNSIDNLFNKRLVDTLKRVTPHRNSGFFKEYLELSQYFEKGKPYGPWEWHTETTQEEYHKNWQVILTNLEKLETKPKALDFLKLSLVNFLDYANKAKKDIDPSKHPDGERNFEYLLTVIKKLENMQNKLKE